MAIDSRYAAFYQSMVVGQPGRWGVMIPNGLTNGVGRIEERDLATGEVVAVLTSPTGNRPTTGLASGPVPVGLWVPAADASGFDHWRAGLFSLAELSDPAVGGALGDVDHDGIANLLEYAFGTEPFRTSTADGLPTVTLETVADSPQIVLRYRRLLGDHGLSYRVETSAEAQQWQDAAAAWATPPIAQPNPDGITETVTCRLAVVPTHPVRFFRVQVTPP